VTVRIAASDLADDGRPVWELDGDPHAGCSFARLTLRGEVVEGYAIRQGQAGAVLTELSLGALHELATLLDAFLDLVLDDATPRDR
jgi:hypothetical protein